MLTRTSFFDRVIERLDKLDPAELRKYIFQFSKEKGYLETVFNSLQEGLIILSGRGTIENFNKAAVQLLSLPEDTALGAPIDRFLREIDWSEMLREGMATSRNLEVQYPEHRFLDFYLVPVEQEGEEREATFAAIFHDVTRTRTATQEAIESERLQAVTLLAAGVAHELGNPLNSLNIHLQLMERDVRKAPDGVKERLQESIEVARKEIGRLDTIISQFLQAIRPTRPELVPGDVGRVVRETIELLQRELEDRDVISEVNATAPLPEVLMDYQQLKQAFYNIIRNAIQAIGKGGIIRVELKSDDEWLIVGFHDNGKGIDPDDLAHISKPYFTTREEGHGLGLMVVQRVVNDHGGRFEIESEKGRGTTMRIKLPRMQKRVHLLQDVRDGG